MNKLFNALGNRLVALPLVAAVCLAACSPEQEGEEMAAPVRPAKIITIGDPAGEFRRVFPGTVVSSDNTVLAFRVGGRLAQLPADGMIGGLVEAGTLLAALEDTDYRNALADAQAAYELAKAQFSRAVKLVEKGYVSETEFDRLQARFKGKNAALNQAQANMAYTRLNAPFSGRIARLMVKNFESVKVDEPVAILEGADKLDIQIQVPTSFMAEVPDKLKAGYRAGMRGLQLFEVEFKNQPGVRYPASVSEIETKPDPATLTYRVIVSMPAPEQDEMLPGMTARVYVDLMRLDMSSPKIKVPVEALFSADEQPLEAGDASVWVLDDETMRIQRRSVVIGDITGYGVEITEGLESGEQIIGAGVHFLNEGTKVRPLEREGGL